MKNFLEDCQVQDYRNQGKYINVTVHLLRASSVWEILHVYTMLNKFGSVTTKETASYRDNR